MRGSAAALLLLPWMLLLLHAAAVGNGSCARSCGALTVQYPFGFSPGCEIPLGCDQANGTAWLGGARELGLLVSNVTARALFLTLRPNCSRRLNASLEALFTKTYAPGRQNALVVSSCKLVSLAADISNCSVHPSAYLDNSSQCGRGAADSIRCVVPTQPTSDDNIRVPDRFFNRTEMQTLAAECTGLVSAVSYWDAPAPALLLATMELEWWMLGPCRCSRQANCTRVTTPVARQEAFRCECREGFEGDGFAEGAGCRKAPKCNPSKYLSGDCGKTIQIVLLVAGIMFGAMVTCVSCLAYQLLKRRSASIRTKRSTKQFLSEASCAVPLYSYREIERATGGFSEEKRLGTGAYGTVYAGRLSDDRLLAVDRIGRGCVDDIVDPYLDPHRDAWTLSSIHKVAELAFRCLAFHSEMRPSMTEVADELEQMQRSGWAPSADDAAFMSTSSSISSSVASTRGTDRSWGAGRSRTERAAVNASLVVQETAAKGAVESPVSVQERWFSERSSPSSNSLLGNCSVH
ncbi:unnamed protein product [Miscanthus lutarioriparius]|uniref:Uncharacterized protein n=1 Tax=Miscanthus lutarioriparius TaxID=422564 RepID=A0A811MC12_9POAL|nr:unnamed protein product [Miscanthus lutarioriparius]